ncbi:MAG: SoxR reducing system RseC family protein [Bacteroidales bacterium]|jgi:sigma-E factor negative regulatory protein RseC|nr:SoxR reducing system RseC family protein [Bacteroidales bacterium]
MEKQVEHEGTVASLSGNTMIVRIVASSACSSCAAKSYCVPSENKDKEICVEGFSGDFVLGEKVCVTMHQSKGMKALLFGYILPFFLVVVTLMITYSVTGNELISGLLALLILIPYYLFIKLFNSRMARSFSFEVKKIN